jgi:hypothetical protein
MRGNLIHIIIIRLWILSIIAAPMALILVPEENKASITLGDGWEEESGESDNLLPDFEKLVYRVIKFQFAYKELGEKEALLTFTPGLCNHISDVIIPPPEGLLN